ncbi:rod shape-determining protein RodA [Gracilibacillus timonensis]|uniref:rod shape-determining protein RodA n=1 Tax=Gracilibacillus timonensis TaxID=1816696 RepID=UPI00082433E6|nr:rod shape-determining protein RodA [Gracilibacillus timonensis]
MLKKPAGDYIIWMILIGLFLISVTAVYSGTGQYTGGESFYFASRQLIWYVISGVLMLAVAQFDYELLEKWALYLYLAGLALLLFVRFFGIERNGSQRWINLGFMELQPSELMKIILVIYLAAIFQKAGAEKMSFLQSLPVIGKALLLIACPFLLILVQPDLGSALLIAVAAFTIIFTSNMNNKLLTGMTLLISGGMVFLWYLFQNHQDILSTFLKPHQLGRINSWLDPTEYSMNFSYQLDQAKLGIGAGHFTGSGFNQGFQVQSGRVPEAHTDFVFAVIGEEFGFIGGSLLIVLYFLLIYRIIVIALKANDRFAVYICVGVVALFAFQVFQNIGMTIGLMPVTGIALPFISYGGSALITNMLALGLVQSIYLRTKNYLFSSENGMET